MDVVVHVCVRELLIYLAICIWPYSQVVFIRNIGEAVKCGQPNWKPFKTYVLFH